MGEENIPSPMLKRALILAIICSVLLSSSTLASIISINDLESKEFRIEYTIETVFDDLIFTKVDSYDLVTLPDSGFINNIGEPFLPAKTIHIVLPFGMKLINVQIEGFDEVAIEGDYFILPSQPPKEIGKKRYNLIEPNVECYSSNEHYPGNNVKFYQTDLVGQSYAEIMLYPVQYIPVEKKLTLLTSITVILEGVDEYTYGDYLPKSISDYGKQMYEKMITDLVVNSDDVNVRKNSEHIYPLDLPAGGPYDHVIITSSQNVPYWEELAFWHTKRGLKDIIVDTDYIYDNYMGSDDQQKIRNFIIEAHNTWGTLYFLMAGEHESVPFKYKTYYYGAGYTPSDQYYSDFDDDWTNEVFVGRTTAEGSEEISIFTNKILTYEKNPPLTDYVKEILLIGMHLFDYTEGEDLKQRIDNYYIPNDFTVTKVYDSHPGNHRIEILDALNEGKHLVNHADHCNYNVMGAGWENHGLYITCSDVGMLTNDNYLSVIVSLGCMPNGMDYDDCISEHFVIRNSNKAGVAFTGNTRNGYGQIGDPYALSGELDYEWWNGLFNHNNYIIGETLAYSKHHFSTYEDIEKHCEWTFNLLGDPAMPLWTDTPKIFDVTHPLSVSDPFTVHVEEDGGGEVSDAYVCLWNEDDIYLTGYTDVNGDITFNPSSSSGKTYVTVTKHNYIPYEGVIGPVIEIGEITGGLGVSAVIKNVGTENADEVSWTITVTGGVFGFINREKSDTIMDLAVGGEDTINLGTLIGLGPIDIVIAADSEEKMVEGSQLFIFTMI